MILFSAISIYAEGKKDKIQTETKTGSVEIDFVEVPTDGPTPAFFIASTETSYEQYVQFLNEAYEAALLIYDPTDEGVYDSNGNLMTSLNGSRVMKDHNRNDIYELEDMENPLNINFIRFNDSTGKFEIEDPMAIDWSEYCNPAIYPNAVDCGA